MGNSCECVRRQTSDEAEDALLASLVGEGTDGRPRGPPPPYQPQAPVYNYALAPMTEERRAQLVRRITIIQSLPCVHYELRSDKEKKKEPRECAICMMDYTAGEPIRLLPCMHYYHLHCIDDWLMRSLTCPTCMERVDTGLVTTIRSGGNTRGHRHTFGLRRRRRQQAPSGGSSSPLTGTGSGSSSRSSSTSSSTEYLMTSSTQSHGHSSQRYPPSNNPQHLRSHHTMAPHPPQNSELGPLPQLVTPPSSPCVVVVHSPSTSPTSPTHPLPVATASAVHTGPIN